MSVEVGVKEDDPSVDEDSSAELEELDSTSGVEEDSSAELDELMLSEVVEGTRVLKEMMDSLRSEVEDTVAVELEGPVISEVDEVSSADVDGGTEVISETL